ncbi:MAG: RNA methyltransferase [Bacteroidota bacterium]
MRKLKNEELKRLSVDAFKKSKKASIVLVLDNVRSAHNVGSAFRTADAFRVEKIYLCGITAIPPHKEINKAALGAQEAVEWEHFDASKDCALKLQNEGYKLVVLEQADQSKSLEDYQMQPNKKYAFVFGNEVFGVDEALVQMADQVLEIPQFGTKHSLNISVSVGVVLWDHYAKSKK